MFWLLRSFFFVIIAAVPAQIGAASLRSETTAGPGIPIRWKDSKITIAVSSSFDSANPAIKQGSDASEALRRSLRTWSMATGIEFRVVASDKTDVSPSGVSGDGVSLITIAPTATNIGVFGGGSAETPATTRIFFDRSGYITEADIVLNPAQVFSNDGTFGTFDLESIITHELGHLLGLEHSPIAGSAMYVHQSKNGLFALAATWSRTLTDSDRSAARSLYGGINSVAECCFEVTGTAAGKRSNQEIIVWAEDVETGAVQTAVNARGGSRFELFGLTEGRYRIFQQAKSKAASMNESVVELSSADSNVEISRAAGFAAVDFELQYLGFNGQLSKMPLVLSSGKTYTIYLAGNGTPDGPVTVGSTSPFLHFDESSLVSHDYGPSLKVFSIGLTIGQNTPDGSYSIYAADKVNNRSFLPGVVLVSNR